MNIQQAFQQWQEIEPASDDYPAMAESWNNFTDALCKDGELTSLQYDHCPAWDDDMPDSDGEPAFLLDAMRVKLTCFARSSRPDDLAEWPEGSKHYWFALSRGNNSYSGFYSMGAAHTSEPSIDDVMHSLLMDTVEIECGDTFEEWADSLGMDSDSRRAERAYKACVAEWAGIQKLFTQSEIDDLRTAFEDY